MNIKDLGRWLKWVVPTTAIIILMIKYREDIRNEFRDGFGNEDSRNAKTQMVQSERPIDETLVITKEWSETIVIAQTLEHQYKFIATIEQPDVPYICEFNGGTLIKRIPARKERPSDWKPDFYPDQLMRVRIKIDPAFPGKEASIRYTINRVDKN